MVNTKHDRNGVRTAADVERKYKMNMIEPTAEDVDELKNVTLVIDDHLSTTSAHSVQNAVITENLNKKVNKEAGKGLSTNDFTDNYKNVVDTLAKEGHTHSNKSVLDLINQTNITNWDYSYEKAHTHVNKSVLDNIKEPAIYDLNNYKTTGVTVNYANCVEKFNRVCVTMNCVMEILANQETLLFTFPNELKPQNQIDFVVFDGEENFGHGYLAKTGELKVKSPVNLSLVKTSFVYDLDNGGD